MVTYNKFRQFIGDVFNGVINHSADTFKVGLTNTAPNVADTDLNTSLSPDRLISTSNADEIAAGNGYTEGGNTLTITTAAQSGGTYTFAANQTVWTCVTAAMATFRYYYLYDNTAGAAATRPIVAWWDHGSAVTLNVGDTFTVKFSGTDPGNIFTAA